MARNRPKAILMGDIVASRVGDQRRLHRVFNDALSSATKKFRNDILAPLTVTLGDEYQGVTKSLSAAMRIANYVALYLRKHDVRCRHVVGYGSIDTTIKSKMAWNMLGAGLSRVRDKLTTKDPLGNRYRFVIETNSLLEKSLDFNGLLLSSTEDDWTDRQAEIIFEVHTTNESHAEIIRDQGISERVFYKILSGAGYHLYNGCFLTILQIFDEIEKQRGEH